MHMKPMPLRQLRTYLKTVRGFGATIHRIVELVPAAVVVLSLLYRGMVYWATNTIPDMTDALPSWVLIHYLAALEVSFAGVLLIAAMAAHATPKATSAKCLAVIQITMFCVMVYSAGMAALCNPFRLAAFWFFVRAFLAGLTFFQIAGEITFLQGHNRRHAERRRLTPPPQTLQQMNDNDLRTAFLTVQSNAADWPTIRNSKTV